MSDASYGELLPFDTDESGFAYGFEAGYLWRKLNEKPDKEVTQTVHGCNAEMFMRMAENLEREFSAVPLDEDAHWVDVTFMPTSVEHIDR